MAIRFLQDHLQTYRERFGCNNNPESTDPCFVLTTRNDVRIRIIAENIEGPIAGEPVTTATAESIAHLTIV